MFGIYEEELHHWLSTLGLTEFWSQTILGFSSVLIIILFSIIAFVIARRFLVHGLKSIAEKTKTQWDDILFEKKVFNRLAYLAPAIVVYAFIPYLLNNFPGIAKKLQGATTIFMVVIALLVISSFLNAVYDIYQRFEISKSKPIKSYLQVLKILIICIGIIIIISVLIGKSPLYILGGLGLFSAVLILVFRDPILGFVGGIQLSGNDMVRPGDWISMPKFGADGTVTDISLTTVKVQNWDKTITTIPTYSLVSDAFQNWRGMEESGGRRIKRSFFINMNSVKFCDQPMLGRFSKIELLKDYIAEKQEELDQYNQSMQIDESEIVNGRRQTNLGVLRAYLKAYLNNYPVVNTDMTLLVRQLQPTATGIPIEIYAFSKVQAWAEFEDIQSDIFDHVLAVIPQFELQVFQNPSGADFKKVIGG